MEVVLKKLARKRQNSTCRCCSSGRKTCSEKGSEKIGGQERWVGIRNGWGLVVWPLFPGMSCLLWMKSWREQVEEG